MPFDAKTVDEQRRLYDVLVKAFPSADEVLLAEVKKRLDTYTDKDIACASRALGYELVMLRDGHLYHLSRLAQKRLVRLWVKVSLAWEARTTQDGDLRLRLMASYARFRDNSALADFLDEALKLSRFQFRRKRRGV